MEELRKRVLDDYARYQATLPPIHVIDAILDEVLVISEEFLKRLVHLSPAILMSKPLDGIIQYLCEPFAECHAARDSQHIQLRSPEEMLKELA